MLIFRMPCVKWRTTVMEKDENSRKWYGGHFMKREFLQGLDLEKEVIDQIMTEYGKNINAEKVKYQQLETEKQNLENQLNEANESIQGFKDEALNLEQVQALAEEWETKYNQAMAQRQADLKATALLAELRNAGTVDAELLKSCIDESSIIYKDGTFIGLSEQIAKIKEEKPYLFVSETDTKPKFKGAQFNESSDSSQEEPVDLSKMSFPEACAYLETHKE